MAALDDNPYAAPSPAADSPPAKPPPAISLINRIVSVALITFATFLVLGQIAGLLIYALDPQTRATEEALDPSAIAAYVIVTCGLYGFGFWLRRSKPS
jgi:polyferredoxin